MRGVQAVTLQVSAEVTQPPTEIFVTRLHGRSHQGQRSFPFEELGFFFYFLKQLFALFAELKSFQDPKANRASDGGSWFCRGSK